MGDNISVSRNVKYNLILYFHFIVVDNDKHGGCLDPKYLNM